MHRVVDGNKMSFWNWVKRVKQGASSKVLQLYFFKKSDEAGDDENSIRDLYMNSNICQRWEQMLGMLLFKKS